MQLKVLVLGGTGAMGKPLCDLLAAKGADVTSVSRSIPHNINEKINYVLGDAYNIEFIKQLVCNKYYDCIVDFMIYSTSHFRDVIDIYLENTCQYVFVSSARVYAEVSKGDFITEESPRLLEKCNDKEYLETDEYALAKARQEDILKCSKSNNWTIIRPSVTYNRQRLQLGGFEKEEWLYRAINGRSIVFSMDLVDIVTTMTFGEDVAKGIFGIIGEKNAYKEVYHITEKGYYTWGEILDIYLDVLAEKLGKRPKVVFTDVSVLLDFRKYQIIYAKKLNRKFNTSKIDSYVDTISFTPAKQGLRECLFQCLESPSFKEINWFLEGINDRVSKEFTSFSEIPGMKNRVRYIVARFGLERIVYLKRKVSSKVKKG